MKTFNPKPKDIEHKTFLIDASGKTLGRLATRVATLLMGKGKTIFSPAQWCGDSVVIVNAKKVFLTGKKSQKKIYTHYTGYPAGLRTIPYDKMLEEKPDQIILKAVSRMLPKNKLGVRMLRALRVYAGPEHRSQAQKPVKIEAL